MAGGTAGWPGGGLPLAASSSGMSRGEATAAAAKRARRAPLTDNAQETTEERLAILRRDDGAARSGGAESAAKPPFREHKFQAEWRIGRPWLMYDALERTMWCTRCRADDTCSNVWATVGLKTLRRPAVTEHEKLHHEMDSASRRAAKQRAAALDAATHARPHRGAHLPETGAGPAAPHEPKRSADGLVSGCGQLRDGVLATTALDKETEDEEVGGFERPRKHHL